MVKGILALAVFCALVKCASAPVSTERLSATEAPIRAAEEMGATQVPQAALNLKLAREEQDKAKEFIKNGDKSRADMMLLRAQADAELALALAKEAPLAAEAKKASEEVRALRQSNQQATP